MTMVTASAYDRCLTTMYGLRRFGIKLGLGTIRQILKELDNPHRRYRLVHVAGTNGKGSVAAALASILTHAGFKTGLYTSPHLVRFNERIVINNRQISNRRVVDAYRAVKCAHAGRREPTFFEFATAMALYDFARQDVQWAVIETGMGGRLDATNIISPSLSIITNVSIEHREYLGNDIATIAGEKAGIIKRRAPVVTGVRQPRAREVIAQKARSCSVPVYQFGRHFKVRRRADHTFDYRGMESAWRGLHIGLNGRHQVDNAALALAACEVLNASTSFQARITDEAVRNGLSQVPWPGRLETVATRPLIILDGAHNLKAARQLARHFKARYSNRRVTLIVGILDDKPYEAMLKALIPTADRLLITRPKIDRSLDPRVLYTCARKYTSRIEIVPGVAEAIAVALDSVGPEDVVGIAGSLYVVGEAKAVLQGDGACPEPV